MSTLTRRIRRAWQNLRSDPGVGRNTLVVILAMAVTLGAGGYMMSKASFEFPFNRATVRAEFGSVPGTNNATTHKVTMSGVEVGTITNSEATDHGTAVLEMSIDSGHPIYSNAHAVLRTINPLNEMYVELSPGGPPGNRLPDGAVLPQSQTERPVQADEALSHLDERSQKAMTTLLSQSDAALARAPQDLPGGLAATDANVVALRPVAERLQQRRDLIAHVVGSLSQISTAVGGDQARTAQLANSTQQALGVLADNDKSLRGGLSQLPGLNDQLRHALTSTQGLTQQLDPTLRDLTAASRELPPALERTTDTAGELGRTAQEARPVVDRARPLVADLRPLVGDVNRALDDAVPVTGTLDNTTKVVTSYLTDLQGFVYNTSSVFGISDGQSSFIRAFLNQPLPDAGAVPGQHGAEKPRMQNGRPAGEVHEPGNTPPANGGGH